MLTYFAVLPFSRTQDGDFLAEAAIEVRSAVEARAMAARMEGPERGAVAFSKTGDPQLGEWQDAVILGRYGDVPDDLASYTSARILSGQPGAAQAKYRHHQRPMKSAGAAKCHRVLLVNGHRRKY